jgi:hypothetical protein
VTVLENAPGVKYLMTRKPHTTTTWPDDGVTVAETVHEWKRPVVSNIVRIREKIALGQRVEFKVDVWRAGDWRVVGEGAGIGACLILRLEGNATNKPRAVADYKVAGFTRNF